MTVSAFMDISVSIMCAFLGLCLSILHVYSNPKRKLWRDLPQRMRRAILLTAVFFLWRSANLSYLAPTETGPGHINPEGFMLTLALTWLAIEAVYYLAGDKLRNGLWDRLRWLTFTAHKRPQVANAAVTVAAVEEAKKAGIVVFEPPSQPLIKD